VFGFNVDEDNKLVTVICDGTLSSDERLKVLDDLIETLKKNPKLNILLDVSQAELNMTHHEQMEYGHLLASKKNYFNLNKTAVVRNINTLYQTLFLSEAYAEGFTNFLEFDNKKEALKWISGEIR